MSPPAAAPKTIPDTALESALENAPANAVEIHGLTKVYPPTGGRAEKRALDNVSLTVPRGCLFGLLGPNGAGKSTLINIMAGLARKTAGTVRVWDMDIDVEPRNARAAIGVVPQEVNIDPFFTPRALLDLQAGLYGVPRRARRTEEILRAVGLWEQRGAYARALSGGMRRRVLIGKAMVHAPPVLVLDEPTAGVDIELRRQLWDNVRALNAQGVTILLTTHYLEEAQELCDRIAIIDSGRVVADQDTRSLLRRLDSKVIRVAVRGCPDAPPPALARFSPTLRRDADGLCWLSVSYPPSRASAGEIIAAVVDAGLSIVDVNTHETDLEDIFLQITGAPPASAPDRVAAG